ncbi:MAG: putative ATP-binding protein involved in virulence [Pseudoalteromonas rhizosphaerae]|jgi:predicted ATP-binding protein involved in virulence|uniref:AAA family ATPase n=1 Tax=Pseudoalteromonas rhizosphaerae TaxID=2518973 RepID=UPI0039E727F6
MDKNLRIETVRPHNGFSLLEPFESDEPLIVITGKNGSGKTRLLQSFSNQSSSATIDSVQIPNEEISYIDHSKLNPNIGNRFNLQNYEATITFTLEFYDKVKSNFDLPFNPDDKIKYQEDYSARNVRINYDHLYSLCNKLGKELKKPPSELSHSELRLSYESDIPNILGFQNVSAIFNQYIKRLEQNSYNKFKATQGKTAYFLSDDEFITRFGNKPWIVINEIVKDTFDNKFQFTEPEEDSESFSHEANLFHTSDGSIVTTQNLSSGEQTLLWLAITLFNTQYYDSETVKSPKLLLIDEPDAFLHPKMVLKMYQVFDSFYRNFGTKIILSTHSPTSVALAPDNAVCLVEQNKIFHVEKDRAISELLDGITQISLNPKNRRQVFVESSYDAEIYQRLYTFLAHRSDKIDPMISLSFVSSGPKMPIQQILDKGKQLLKEINQQQLEDFAQALNGIGNCSQVIGQVQALVDSENNTVRGIIDWDKTNNPIPNISVLAQGVAYSIENLALDPLAILLLLHIDFSDRYSIKNFSGDDVNWNTWLNDPHLLQKSLDQFIENIFNRPSKKDVKIEYILGLQLDTDSEYLTMYGHSLEDLIKTKYPILKSYIKNGKDGMLKAKVVSKSMLQLSSGMFVPKLFEDVISEAQK